MDHDALRRIAFGPPSPGQKAERRRTTAHRIDTRQLTVADVEALIAAALCVERQIVIPIIGEAVNELLDAERTHEPPDRTRPRIAGAGVERRAPQ
jgi:hypothetical protein